MRCGESWAPENLDVHHLIGGKYDRPNHRWNYLLLCRACHEAMHGMIKLAEGLEIKASCDPENHDAEAMRVWLIRHGRRILE